MRVFTIKDEDFNNGERLLKKLKELGDIYHEASGIRAYVIIDGIPQSTWNLEDREILEAIDMEEESLRNEIGALIKNLSPHQLEVTEQVLCNTAMPTYALYLAIEDIVICWALFRIEDFTTRLLPRLTSIQTWGDLEDQIADAAIDAFGRKCEQIIKTAISNGQVSGETARQLIKRLSHL